MSGSRAQACQGPHGWSGECSSITVQHELWGHVGDGADGLGLDNVLLANHACHAKVGHLGGEAPLVITGAGQQHIVGGQVAVQDVQVMQIRHSTAPRNSWMSHSALLCERCTLKCS